MARAHDFAAAGDLGRASGTIRLEAQGALDSHMLKAEGPGFDQELLGDWVVTGDDSVCGLTRRTRPTSDSVSLDDWLTVASADRGLGWLDG